MKKKIKLIILLACCSVALILGGAVGLVSCDKAPADPKPDQNWTSNY